MKNFDAVAKIPGVVAVALSDDSGKLLELSGNIDGETAGGVHAFAAQSLGRAGELLGLGLLERITVTDPKRSCIAMVLGDEVLGVYADSGKHFVAIEKRLEDIITK